MKHGDDEDSDDVLEPAHDVTRPGKSEPAAGEFDDFDEEDFDDEFDDDFEEELEDEYDLSEFGDPTEDDLAEDADVDVTALGDFVDEDAEPEEPPAALEEGAEEPEAKGKAGKESGKKSKSKKKSRDEDDED